MIIDAVIWIAGLTLLVARIRRYRRAVRDHQNAEMRRYLERRIYG